MTWGLLGLGEKRGPGKGGTWRLGEDETVRKGDLVTRGLGELEN
jgi:hypothetical protein